MLLTRRTPDHIARPNFLFWAALALHPPAPRRAQCTSLFDFDGSLLMPLSLPFFPFLNKYVIRDCIPGIVNANKEEQQRCSGNDEQTWALMGVRHVCRSSQHCIRRKWKQNM